MALQYFDAAYGLQLGPLWPSVRCSLLSERKYGALINAFADHEAVESDLRDQGCSDFVSAAQLEGKRVQMEVAVHNFFIALHYCIGHSGTAVAREVEW